MTEPGARKHSRGTPPETALRGPKDPRGPIEFALATAALTPPADFAAQAEAIGVSFDPGDVEKLGLYLADLMAANDAMNLTAVRDANEAWTRHILDSLTLVGALADLPEGAEVVDVGSGGGLPGMPLAICMPHLKFTLMEATGKKAEFLRRVIAHLGLGNARVAEVRAEVAGHDRGEKTGTGRVGGHRERYDAAIARAVGRMATLAELVVPLVKLNGRALLIKGAQADEEVAEASGALTMLNAVHVSTIPTPTGRIVALEKRVATPRLYPRRDGEPKRSPLGVGKSKRAEQPGE
jgi:16S rRNA (guanine527-N7)-methyltransferase